MRTDREEGMNDGLEEGRAQSAPEHNSAHDVTTDDAFFIDCGVNAFSCKRNYRTANTRRI